MPAPLLIDGVAVHIDGHGAETIVMVHGWPDTYRLWDGQVAALEGQYRCVRFTLPGFEPDTARRGYSLTEIITLLQHIVEQVSPGQPVILLVHDWGSLFGYQFAMRHPELVSRIVSVDIGDVDSAAFRATTSLAAKAMIVAYQVWLAIAWRVGGGVGEWMTHFMARKLRCPSDPSRIAARMNYPYYIYWARAYGSYQHLLPVEPAYPLLFIYGRRKPFMLHSRAWEEQIRRQASCKVLALDTGHWVMTGQPAAFNAAVDAWLAETRPMRQTVPSDGAPVPSPA